MKVVNIVVPPDKSISQRAIMLASISEGTTRIKNLLMGDDCLRAIDAFRAMGVRIDVSAKIALRVVVHGVGMYGLKKPGGPLYLGNSGTAMRILPGILAGQDFSCLLKGDRSLSARPMRRIAEPLKKMGVEIASAPTSSRPRDDSSGCVIASEAKQSREIYPPLKIKGGKLKAIKYRSSIASAQVKSCILLAGLYADGVTSVSEPVKSRDHTERMLEQFGVKFFSTRSARSKNIVRAKSRTIKFRGPVKLKSPGTIEIPGDISSAAFFIVAACILPDMKVVLKNVGLNPTRTGVIDILKRMGADIRLTNLSLRGGAKRRRSNLKERDYFASLAMTRCPGEPTGDIIVRSGRLKGVVISAKEVVRAIDEIPVIMAAACFAEGKTVIRGIGELRVKETDRIRSMVTNLRKLGADIEVKGEGSRQGGQVRVKGGRLLHGATVSSFGDHRTAMSMLVAGLAVGGIKVTGLECIKKSFPCFQEILRRLKPAAPSCKLN